MGSNLTLNAAPWKWAVGECQLIGQVGERNKNVHGAVEKTNTCRVRENLKSEERSAGPSRAARRSAVSLRYVICRKNKEHISELKVLKVKLAWLCCGLRATSDSCKNKTAVKPQISAVENIYSNVYLAAFACGGAYKSQNMSRPVPALELKTRLGHWWPRAKVNVWEFVNFKDLWWF